MADVLTKRQSLLLAIGVLTVLALGRSEGVPVAAALASVLAVGTAVVAYALQRR